MGSPSHGLSTSYRAVVPLEPIKCLADGLRSFKQAKLRFPRQCTEHTCTQALITPSISYMMVLQKDARLTTLFHLRIPKQQKKKSKRGQCQQAALPSPHTNDRRPNKAPTPSGLHAQRRKTKNHPNALTPAASSLSSPSRARQKGTPSPLPLPQTMG